MPILNRSRSCFASLILTFLAVSACGSGPSMDSLRSTVVATAGSAQLTGADLERWLMASPLPPDPETASSLTSTWIDQALLADAVRSHLDLTDSIAVDSMLAPELTMSRLLTYYQDRSKQYPPITDAQADSLFDAGNVRVFQRVMLRILPENDERARAGAESRLGEIRTRVEAGGENFTALVKALSESPDGASGGFSTLTGEQVPGDQLNGHLWTLRPGDFSRIYSSGRLTVLYRRAEKGVSRDSLKGWLAPVLARRADGKFVDSLMAASEVVIAKDAAARVRQMAAEPGQPVGETPLITWKGGAATPARVARWLWVLDPSTRFAMQNASDDQAHDFLRSIAQRDLVLALAGVGGDNVNARQLRERFRESLGNLVAEIQQAGTPIPADFPLRLLDSLTVSNRPYNMVPAGVGAWLRARFPVSLDQQVLTQVTRAIAIQYAERAASGVATNSAADPEGQ